MPVDYNLVILGDSPAAYYAATYARHVNARVALIPFPELSSSGTYRDVMAIQTLRHLSRSLIQQTRGPYDTGRLLFRDQSSTIPPTLPGVSSLHWPSTLPLIQTLIEGQQDGRSLPALEHLGVDVMYGERHDDRQFCVDPDLGFTVGQRTVRSQAYLIALDGDAIVPAIDGIEQVPHYTLETFFTPDSQSSLPSSILIATNNFQGIEVAHSLASLGVQVTLVLQAPLDLPPDEEAHQWIQAILESVGVSVWDHTQITRLYPQEEQCCAELAVSSEQSLHHSSPDASSTEKESTSTITSECLLVVMGRQVDFTTLHLKAIGVNYDVQGIGVNARYQSSHSRVFACGGAIGTAPLLNQRYAEAAIATHQALFRGPLPWGLKQWLNPPLPPAPHMLPAVVGITPPFAQVGFTETDARARYGDQICVLRQSFQSLDQAQLLNATTGFCKLFVLSNGQIVGGQIMGIQAEELIGAIALAMQQSLPIGSLVQLCPPAPSILADLLQALTLQWQRDRRQRRSLLFDWLELAFNWQRDWTR